MSCEWNPCAATCPPVTVTIQPPPFVLSIPGPSIYCPDQPVCIQQYNPCAPCIEGPNRGAYRSSSAAGRSSGANAASIYSQKIQQSSACRRC